MGTRTVRLDDEAERTLAELRRLTGLSISEVLKRGLIAFQRSALEGAAERPYDIYSRLDLGPGGSAAAPAARARAAVAGAIAKKHRR